MSEPQHAEDHTPHESHDAAYWKVLVALAVFTVIELAIPSVLPEPRWLLVVLMMLTAVAKAAGVALYYMHIKYEKPLVALLAFSPIIFVGIFFFLIMADITEVDKGGWTFPETQVETKADEAH